MSPGLKMKYTSQTGQNITYLDEGYYFFSTISKPTTIRWISTGSQPDRKIMYSIELQIIFYEH